MADDRLMRLTSPHMKGSGVAALQRLLKKNGHLQAKVDGEFGPDTHRAVYKAKYWLGYPKPDHVAGDKLYAYLEGSKKPTLAMRTLAAKRKRAIPKVPLGVKVLTNAVKYLGIKEKPPGSNKTMFSTWYGVIGPWCAMFCTYNGVMAGSKVFKRGSYWAYVPFIVSDARAGNRGLAITYRPVDGDMVCFDWEMAGRAGVADHVGLYATQTTLQRIAPEALRQAIKQFGKLSTNDFWCVEGNTGVGNDSNGGQVMIRKRSKSQVQAFVHYAR